MILRCVTHARAIVGWCARADKDCSKVGRRETRSISYPIASKREASRGCRATRLALAVATQGATPSLHLTCFPSELNRFLQESPTRQREVMENITPEIKITYSPIFTGVHASKDAQLVVNTVHNAGLARLVARLKPIIVVKG